ncbi:MAG: adenosylcobinamide-phosphate synthase CbiB [Pseudomonadota bacterium]
MLALALVLDALIGEPRALWQRVPHPVVLMGRLIDMLDEGLNRGRARRLKGAFALVVLIAVVGALSLFLSVSLFHGVLEVALAAVLLAHRSLIEHVRAVAGGLRRSLDDGRAAVAHIVGRDVRAMDREAVVRASVESAAENFSDAVVAPAFWFAVAGLPGIAVYKAINTADSMIGHRTPRHEAFGWASARVDDLVNWIPARLSGLAIAAVGGGRRAVEVMLTDAPLHRSPNAGWPEAAMAASLGIRLSGPRSYDGRPTEEPWINGGATRPPTVDDIDRALVLAWRAWALLLGAALLLWLAGVALYGLPFAGTPDADAPGG